ncbi:MAG: T9SS type A sorting domain-containing protein, partial [Bacteroidales bacterium]|nr:T9SS type A sorting domain-containing protein [Bacteroidales bacterium]
TGGNALIYYNNINFPDSSNVWQVNPFVSAKISFCIDASNWDNVTLSFDLKQTSGGATYSMIFGEGDYDKTSSMRILVNDQQIGTTYNPKTYTSDLWKTHSVNLDQFANSQFTLTIESRCICKDTTYYGSLIRMDNVYLDNIAFSNVFKNIKKINAGAFAASIYPMPAKDYYTINIDSDMPQAISIQTIDLFGKIINSGTYNINSGNNRLKFYTDLLSNSVYFLKISSKTQTNTLKLIKTR